MGAMREAGLTCSGKRGAPPTMHAAYFGDLQASIGFLEGRHDLAIGESALLHWFGSVIPTRLLSFQTVPCEGKRTGANINILSLVNTLFFYNFCIRRTKTIKL
jgi:hypothetical protein